MDRRRLTHEEVELDLPAFVIGALDADEALAVSAHIDHCALCQEERIRLEQTIGFIGASVPAFDLPAGLRAHVLGKLDEADHGLEQVDENIRERPSRIIRRLSSFGLPAAAVLLIGLLAWTMLLRSDLNHTQGNLNQKTQQQSVEMELLASSSRMIPLVADTTPNAYGTLYIGSQNNQALLVVEELPPTPPNQMYQVWLINGSTRITAGLFTVDQSGSATVMIKAPSTLTSYQSLGITSEPGPNGSASPTGPRIIGCPLH